MSVPSSSMNQQQKPQLFFIRIEKTAGGSILRSLIQANVQTYYLEGGYRAFSSYWQGRHADCVHGHVPYGLQVLTRRPVQYIAMLREPVDRVVSFYHFIRESGRLTNHNVLKTLEKSKTAVRTPIYRGALLVRTCVNGGNK